MFSLSVVRIIGSIVEVGALFPKGTMVPIVSMAKRQGGKDGPFRLFE